VFNLIRKLEMKKILLIIFSLSLNCFAETKLDGSYPAPASIRGLCGELEQSIVAYNKGWIESNRLWADAMNNRKSEQVKLHSNNSDAVKKSLDDSVDRWNKLDCTSIIYSKTK
jgi:hypothetical protein